ncbi:keratinocyte-associated protein 3 isoform X2 [Gadus morhua]|uniref:keratinocyte-associated protein 3 isoform X2 n=1 Tax=Gadus morhua TaxID=8049 RepID=UPI0011B70BDA|nr:keratinocyte-associated protein 3-like isoform X2 [Gadus morhua]
MTPTVRSCRGYTCCLLYTAKVVRNHSAILCRTDETQQDGGESLEDPNALMRMGLSVILIGHVNFLLGALVHGAVLRHINLHKQARAMEYSISNVMALSAGLVAIIVGILAIILSKNKSDRKLTWALFALSLLSSLMGAAAAVGLLLSVVRAIVHGGRSLLTHCRFPDAIGYSSITNECPFDPTRIYSTTLILWAPLIVTCLVQLVFCSQCFAACISFLGLTCCPGPPADRHRVIDAVRTEELPAAASAAAPPRYTPPPRYAPPPRRPQQQQQQPTQQHRPQNYMAPQFRSLPPTERQRGPPRRARPEERGVGGGPRGPEQHRLLDRATLDRSSFWV